MSGHVGTRPAQPWRAPAMFAGLAALLILEGVTGSWNSALGILNMGLISAVMALGLNMQWGYAGLFNTGVVGMVAIGGLAPVLIAMPPVGAAWAGGGLRMALALLVAAAVVGLAIGVARRMAKGLPRTLAVIAVLVGGFFLYRALFDPAVAAIEGVNPASEGYLGGLGLPVLLAWPVGGLLAAGASWMVAKTALGLRSDYLAIATLGIGEIIVSVLKNEDWLARGVKNVTGIPRPVPYEVALQQDPGFVAQAARVGLAPVQASTLWVQLCWSGLFLVVLLVLIFLMERALNSPWGRMMRAIRDNETAAEAMGKDVKRRHLQIFVLGGAVIGLAGAMMITLDGQMTPGSYTPLRFTFVVWLMVILGGSGSNWGAVLGGVLVWYLWVKVEPWGNWLMGWLAAPLPEGALKAHLIGSAAHMRLLTMGLILLVVLRFSPRGLLPEK
ncbi:branched-chain amino acid ABC transporter permease [Frigidibacter sp. MR17.14]|uniref:branched-chain amino acid ABC transporter permease n=1 Tax=Frigidibacter sp. MR17.14 TaxID=3126509 RepID=UPI003012E34F